MNGVDNGVILIKNTPNMKQLLLDCYNDSRFFHTKTPEQSAMLTLLQEERYNEFIGWI
jgi:hypothetical protein